MPLFVRMDVQYLPEVQAFLHNIPRHSSSVLSLTGKLTDRLLSAVIGQTIVGPVSLAGKSVFY